MYSAGTVNRGKPKTAVFEQNRAKPKPRFFDLREIGLSDFHVWRLVFFTMTRSINRWKNGAEIPSGSGDITQNPIDFARLFPITDRYFSYISATRSSFWMILSPLNRPFYCEQNKPSTIKIGLALFVLQLENRTETAVFTEKPNRNRPKTHF